MIQEVRGKPRRAKHMLILAGPANSGKSTALGLTYQVVLRRAVAKSDSLVTTFLYYTKREIGVAINTPAVFGLMSRGDSARHVQRGLEFLQSQRCSVIVCATRASGKPLEAAQAFARSNGFSVELMEKPGESVVARQARDNELVAHQIRAWAYQRLGLGG